MCYPPNLATQADSHPPCHQQRETWHSLHLQATSIHYTQNNVAFSHFFFLCCFSETLAAEPT